MANLEHLELLKKGVKVWNKNKPSNLIRIDLVEADLHGAKLREVNLTKADLRGANLAEATLIEAILYKVDFSNAKLSRARFIDAVLNKAIFVKADLVEADLRYTKLSRTNFGGANLRGANLHKAKLYRANLKRTELLKANLTKSDLRWAILSEANLSQAILIEANLSKTLLKETNLIEADLSNANLTKTYCSKANFTDANLSFARLSNANLDGAILTGARLWESQRAGWSIKDVTCEYAYLENKNTPTYFSPGEFEKLYSDKTKIVLSYQDGISPLEIATLPALIKLLESFYPGCSLRLESIRDVAGGASLTLVVDNDSNFSPEEAMQIKAQLEERGRELIEYQKLALQEKHTRLMLEGKVEALSDVVKEFIIRPTHQIGGVQMGDNYTVGQGIAGKDVHDIHDIDFNQIGGQIERSMDLTELATQLKQLREAMSQEAKEPEHYIALGEIAKAEEAAKAKDSSKVAESLKTAGKWALDFATKIGVSLATDALKKSMGT